MLRRASQRVATHSTPAASLQICPPLSALSLLSIHPPRKNFGMHHLFAQRWLSSVSTPDKDALVQTKKTGPTPFNISSIDPSKYSVKDIVDLSGITRKYVSFTGFSKPGCGLYYKHHGTAIRGGVRRIPFPPNSKGIFYFHDRSSIHPVAGDLRFRVLPMDSVKDTASVDLADLFARGHDLFDHAGLRPWRVSLLSIISRRRKSLYSAMKASGHVTETAEAQVHRLKIAHPASGLRVTEQIVERITNPFALDLSKSNESFIFLHEEGIIPYRFMTWQATTKYQKGVRFTHGKALYSGIVLVRLETIRQGSRSRVVMRALKYLKPPNPGDSVVQEEGELLKKYDPIDKTEQPWMAMTTPKFLTPSSLKLLEDTYTPKDR